MSPPAQVLDPWEAAAASPSGISLLQLPFKISACAF